MPFFVQSSDHVLRLNFANRAAEHLRESHLRVRRLPRTDDAVDSEEILQASDLERGAIVSLLLRCPADVHEMRGQALREARSPRDPDRSARDRAQRWRVASRVSERRADFGASAPGGDDDSNRLSHWRRARRRRFSPTSLAIRTEMRVASTCWSSALSGVIPQRDVKAYTLAAGNDHRIGTCAELMRLSSSAYADVLRRYR